MDIYQAMRSWFGHRNWWPGETPFEICVGAILTQNTSWKNVVKAIQNLKDVSALDPFAIYEMPLDKLAEHIRSAGYYNVKARRLHNLVRYIVEDHSGDLNSLITLDIGRLRKELLAVNGVGKETADSIILYVVKKPIFVIDAYTKRILERHNFVDGKVDYDTMQELFHDNLPVDTELYNDFHAQFVAVGHNFCKRTPRCDGCPLEKFLVQR